MAIKRSSNKAAPAVHWEKAFIDAYRQCGSMSQSCDIAGIDRSTVHRRAQAYPEFMAMLEEAREEATDRLEAICRKRAEANSDVLLMFLLKALKPEKYRDSYHVETSTKPTSYVIDLTPPSDPPSLTDVTPATLLEQ